MKYCVNPYCQKPENLDTSFFCQSCHSGLILNQRFRPIEMIGQGGFGRTFKGIDEHNFSESKCLIKQLLPLDTTGVPRTSINLLSKSITRGRQAIDQIPEIYRTEVVQLANLNHPQIPKLISNFEQDGYSYIIQEFVEGRNLEEELKRKGAFNEGQVLQIFIELLPIIKYIHTENIIHRDIKPENILRPIGEKPLVLVDFGAAKLFAPREDDDEFETSVQFGIGTPSYMAPEQQKGREVLSSDLYSLGVTCIRLLTNATPEELFDDGTNSWVWKDRCQVSNKLGLILDKLLEFGTTHRYQSSDEVLEDVYKLLNKKPLSSEDNNSKNQTTFWSKITALGTVAQGLGALLAVAVSVGLIRTLTASPTKDALDRVSLSSTRSINYSKLREYLREKKWKESDLETYELVLKNAGKKSQLRGYIKFNEINKLSCTDLKTIDKLWRVASDGKLGFSAQQLIYEKQRQSWQKLYNQIGWGKLTDGNLVKTVEQELNWETRRMVYKVQMEPNFKNPSPGHLPVTANLVQGIAFPQFAEICKF